MSSTREGCSAPARIRFTRSCWSAAARAIQSADLLVFVVDGRQELLPGDREIAEAVREADKTAILAINKTDDKRAKAGVMDFYQLGFDPVLEISAEHGAGVGDLLDEVVQRLRPGERARHVEPQRHDEDDHPEGFVFRGEGRSGGLDRRPSERGQVVARQPAAARRADDRQRDPGTTRDAVDTLMTWHRRKFRIVDTAGIRRAGRVGRGGQVESVSVLLARRSIESADIVVLIVDATQGATDQDAAIARRGRQGGTRRHHRRQQVGPGEGRRAATSSKGFDEQLRRQLKFLDYAPILHISALTGERAPKLLETIDRVTESRQKRVKTPELNKFVAEVTAAHPPASPGRTHVRILYAAQTGVAPPTFVFFTNVATNFHFSYERFPRQPAPGTVRFEGTPIRFHVRTRRRKERPDGSARE